MCLSNGGFIPEAHAPEREKNEKLTNWYFCRKTGKKKEHIYLYINVYVERIVSPEIYKYIYIITFFIEDSYTQFKYLLSLGYGLKNGDRKEVDNPPKWNMENIARHSFYIA